jgi:hypothetical protein
VIGRKNWLQANRGGSMLGSRNCGRRIWSVKPRSMCLMVCFGVLLVSSDRNTGTLIINELSLRHLLFDFHIGAFECHSVATQLEFLPLKEGTKVEYLRLKSAAHPCPSVKFIILTITGHPSYNGTSSPDSPESHRNLLCARKYHHHFQTDHHWHTR